ncbi:auxilin-like clathrin-binding protein required for normal clathrin function [Marasmius crinis-equi]|uniref:Auxilin-like clathrin-binding protein required for normal clathrin function n=1 Tax=Marasmius crinis-equi TaxID=585013 RepID=A0ABR3EVH5_9AGAR
MSDSFSDLWSSNTSTSKPGKATLGSLSSSNSSSSLFNNSSSNLSGGRQNHSNDLFSQLSASGSSSSTPRTGSRVGTPALGGGYGQPQPKRTETSGSGGGGDAFGDLFSSSGISGSSKNMTMAQRAAQAEKERREKLMAEQAVKKKQDAAWAGLDFLGSDSSSSATSSQPKASSLEDDWGFGTAATSQSTKTASTPAPVLNDDDWGLDDFASAPPTTQSTLKPSSTSTSLPRKPDAKAQSQGSLWDLDGFGEGNAKGASSRVDSPSRDFDWGDREDAGGLLGDGHGGGQDDILGDLGKPARSRPETLQRPTSSQSTRVSRKPPARTSSPPPHILGQLVEMGFSITQAKAALAATDSGEDVQAALDFLISNGAAGGGDDGRQRSRRASPDEDERGRGSDEPPELPRRPNARRQGSDRGQVEPDRANATSPRSMRERDRMGAQSTQANISEHADKFLTQASTIGMSLFNRANAAWKDVQKVAGEKVQKAYEERRGANERQRSTGAGAGASADGRPKWWREDSGGDEDGEPSQRPPQMPPRPRERERERERFVDDEEGPQNEERRGHANGRPQPQPEPEPEVDLFSSPAPVSVKPTTSESTPGAYVSRFRHGRPKPSPTASSGSGGPSTSRQAAASPQQRTEPHPTTLVLASPVALRTSSVHRAKGTSFFKLGDFPAAEGEYTKAIECLPNGQTALITLFNNRALVRLKVGNSTGVIEDAGKVIELVGSGTGTVRGGVEGGETGGLDGVELDVNLGDAIVKAWKRRAEAFEGKEKWEEAGRDWEKVAGAEWAGQGARGEGVRGAGRCRRMLNQQRNPEPPKSRPPPPRARPKAVTPTPSNSEALKNLRDANLAAENEDAEKHALKDSVDSRLLAWKGGKETNIRALLASLEMVLWPELGVPKWGMHELISEGQVKIKYMKAIAKVHPDKLSAGTYTVEQKMLAQGVFGTLNEAWNAFKQ